MDWVEGMGIQEKGMGIQEKGIGSTHGNRIGWSEQGYRIG